MDNKTTERSQDDLMNRGVWVTYEMDGDPIGTGQGSRCWRLVANTIKELDEGGIEPGKAFMWSDWFPSRDAMDGARKAFIDEIYDWAEASI